MTWENNDINVVEKTNVPKFSKLDNAGVPVRHFELFFNDTLVDLIVSYTKLPSTPS